MARATSPQAVISLLMAVTIIVKLKVVDIAHDDAQGLVFPFVPFPLAIQHFVKMPSIGHLG
jgi:hypothetical protein